MCNCETVEALSTFLEQTLNSCSGNRKHNKLKNNLPTDFIISKKGFAVSHFEGAGKQIAHTV